jgi:uncharacterized protein YjbJ (UPF0337 family)
MPYTVISDAEGCDGFAVVKEGETKPIPGGCHDTQADAIEHMVAIEANYGEGREGGYDEMLYGLAEMDAEGLSGRQVAMYDLYERIAEVFGKWDQTAGANGSHYITQSPFADEGMVCANCVFYRGGGGCQIVSGQIAANGVCKLWVIPERLMSVEPEESGMADYEDRAVNLVAPAFMRTSARRGLALHEQGESGDGLVPATVADARRMANGDALSEAKWRKIGPWIARHIVDLDAVDKPGEITPGLVAMLLWGGGSSKASALRAQAYAERIVERLNAEEMRAPAPPKDQIKGSDENAPGSAKDKTGGITLDASTEKALQTKADEHNEKMRDDGKPEWTRVRLGALKAVWRRGAGAYSTSHRPGISRAAWAMARVNAFLYLARNGRPENPNYVSDNDLLHPDHPRYPKGD